MAVRFFLNTFVFYNSGGRLLLCVLASHHRIFSLFVPCAWLLLDFLVVIRTAVSVLYCWKRRVVTSAFLSGRSTCPLAINANDFLPPPPPKKKKDFCFVREGPFFDFFYEFFTWILPNFHYYYFGNFLQRWKKKKTFNFSFCKSFVDFVATIMKMMLFSLRARHCKYFGTKDFSNKEIKRNKQTEKQEFCTKPKNSKTAKTM